MKEVEFREATKDLEKRDKKVGAPEGKEEKKGASASVKKKEGEESE
jgi:hypothetical protein